MARYSLPDAIEREPQLGLLSMRLTEALESSTQRLSDVSFFSGISEASIFLIVNDVLLPSSMQIGKLSLALGVSTDWLLGLADDPKPSLPRQVPSTVRCRNRLRSAAKSRHLTLTGLARETGLCKGTISKYLAGRLPDLVSAIRLSRVLGVSCDWILGISPANAIGNTPPPRIAV